MWMLLTAWAVDKTAQCSSGKTNIVFQPVVFDTSKKRSLHGLLAPEGLVGRLPNGVMGELRYEHAYGATFVILDLSRGAEMLARSTVWLSSDFNHGTNGVPEGPPKGLPIGSISLDTRIDGALWTCTGNFL